MNKLKKSWINLWGNKYKVIKNDKVISKLLIYHKKVYVIDKEKGK